MKVVKTYHLFINSANRQEGTNYDFTIDVPHEINVAVDKEKGQSIKLTLLKLSTYLEFYNITFGQTDTVNFFKYDVDGNQTGSHSITIPEGNYTYARLATALSTGNPFCIVSYVSRLNKFLFNFTINKGGVSFVNNSHRAFGFNTVDLVYTSVIDGFNILYSPNALKPRTFDRLNVSLYNVIPTAENFINDYTKYGADGGVMVGKYFKKSNLLSSIAINNPPFTLLEYIEGPTDNMGMFVNDKRLKKLRFVITNEFDELLTVLKDTFMILRLEIFEEDDEHAQSMKVLKQINEWLKLTFVSKNLN